MKTTKMVAVLVLVLGVGLPGGITKADFTFGELVNLGSTVNSSNHDSAPSVSTDGMILFFNSDRLGGMGALDIWITELQTTRQMTELVWGKPINLGPVVNSAADEFYPEISADGLWWWESDLNLRPGGFGRSDLWVATRESTEDDWRTPVNIGPTINGSSYDSGPSISADGLSLYFASTRLGGSGNNRGTIKTTFLEVSL